MIDICYVHVDEAMLELGHRTNNTKIHYKAASNVLRNLILNYS